MSKRERSGLGITLTGFLLRLILIIIFVLLLLWLLPMPNLKHYYSSAFGQNIDKMKDAAMSYYTNERLPKTEKDSVKMTLKEMLDAKLLLPFVDSKGKKCDEDHSYVEVTKSGNEYLMKIYLSCDSESDYIVVPMGCYDKCENGNCQAKVCTTDYQYKKTVSGTKKVPYCKSGYTLKAGKCYKTSDIENLTDAKYKYTCTGYTGYSLSGSNCVKETKVTEDATCPSGYTGNGTNCVKKTTDKKDAVCPTGYNGNGTNCVKITTEDTTTYIAPDGTTRVLIRTYTTKDCDTCSTVRHYVYRITKTASYKCSDSSYTLNGTTCTKTITSTKPYQCKDSSYTLSGTKCTKTTTDTKPAKKSYYCETGKLVGTQCSTTGQVIDVQKPSYKIKSYKFVKYTWSNKTSLAGWTKTGKTKTTCK